MVLGYLDETENVLECDDDFPSFAAGLPVWYFSHIIGFSSWWIIIQWDQMYNLQEHNEIFTLNLCSSKFSTCLSQSAICFHVLNMYKKPIRYKSI